MVALLAGPQVPAVLGSGQDGLDHRGAHGGQTTMPLNLTRKPGLAGRAVASPRPVRCRELVIACLSGVVRAGAPVRQLLRAVRRLPAGRLSHTVVHDF